jgi:outer membrane lipoprotein carrier protein
MKRFIAAVAICFIAINVHPTPANAPKSLKIDGVTTLERFVAQVRFGSAEFNQTVTTPAREGGKERVRQSRGTLEFARPNQFRLSYAKPFEQVIASDGQTLAVHDVDLNQLTLRKMSTTEALAGSPAALLASAANWRALNEQFRFAELAAPEATEPGVVWVLAEPKARDGQVQRMELAIQASTLALVQLRMLDSLGQRSVLRFANWRAQAAPAATRFRVEPPPGTDVVRQ